jgi:hypothetical protein
MFTALEVDGKSMPVCHRLGSVTAQDQAANLICHQPGDKPIPPFDSKRCPMN